MKLIDSFSVDHTLIVPGIFVSREDKVGGDTVMTYDIRLKRPNREPVIDVAAMHEEMPGQPHEKIMKTY